MVKPGTMKVEAKMEAKMKTEMEMECKLTHSAVIARSTCALKVPVPFEFCYRSV